MNTLIQLRLFKQNPYTYSLREMGPFNIKTIIEGKEITLTILPEAGDYYKVIYYGGIITGIKKVDTSWMEVEREKVACGTLPWYEDKTDLDDGLETLEVNKTFLEGVGKAIEQAEPL